MTGTQEDIAKSQYRDSTYPGAIQKLLVLEGAYHNYYLADPDSFHGDEVITFIASHPNCKAKIDWMIVPMEGDAIDDNIPDPWGAMSTAQADFEDVNASQATLKISDLNIRVREIERQLGMYGER